MIWVIKPTAGVIAIILPDTLANVLALTLWELLSTAEISADNYNTFFSGTRNLHRFKAQRNPNHSIGFQILLSLFGTKPDLTISFLTTCACS